VLRLAIGHNWFSPSLCAVKCNFWATCSQLFASCDQAVEFGPSLRWGGKQAHLVIHCPSVHDLAPLKIIV